MLTKLILENYIPLQKNGINYVELDLNAMVNLFIAQNGVGKTSILKEVNQLPPEAADFDTGGRKYGEWKIEGKHYIFDSRTGVSDGHSFKLNGEELNKGGTFMAQKELCWTHFKLDRPRAKFLSGLKVYDLFSNLTPARRKDILLWLYPNDTTYAMGVFNKLKSERNELKAVLKNQVSRYADESEKLKRITECGVDELEARIKHIDEELRKSLLIRGSLEEYKIHPGLRQKIEQFEYLSTALTVNKVSGFIESEDELVEGIEMTERLIDNYEENIAAIQHTIGENAGLLEGVEEYLQDPLLFQNQADQLETEINQLKSSIKEQTVILGDYPVFNEEEMSFQGLDLVYDSFVAQLHCVTNANDSSINGAVYKQMEIQLNNLNNRIRDYEGKLSAGGHQLKHYNSAEAVECPDCKHNFKVGINEKDIHRLRADVDSWTVAIGNLEKERDVVADKLDNDRSWYESMVALHQFCRMRSDAPCLGVLVKDFNVGKSEISNLLNALRAYKTRFDATKRIESLLEEKNLIETRIGLMNRDNVLDVASFVEGWERELVKDQKKLAFYNRRLKTFNGRLAIIRNYGNDLAKLNELKEEIFQGLFDEGYVKFRKQLDERISILTEEKEDNLRSIITSRSLSAVVDSIHDEVLRLRKRMIIVETWMDKLCPNKGFIGKLLTDFIKTFCGNANAMIQDVWNTPLYVKPCNKANGDLTYRFPVVVGDSKPVPDMSDCSLGQTGIIDFAMRLTALTYHGYFPLIMDEVGTNLDEVKRTRFFNFVRELAQKKDARQIFCVSHYLSSFGVFSKPNVVAMKHDGLTLPAEPNKNNTIN
jgi:energy-coupling factor transporter ATP-binding protein EcfA2